MSRIGRTLVLASVLIAGCGTVARPQLTPVGEEIPAGVSLAGRWELREGEQDAARRIREAGRRTGGGLEDVIAPSHRERAGYTRNTDGPSVYVFLRRGSTLKITQTPYGLFISFDRSVVEEYRFREHRLVNVGPIEADRVSGWQDGRYVIRTLDDEGALLEETYALRDGGDVLVRTVSVVIDDDAVLELRQTYDRVD